ncbi:acyl-CoA carboxylase epsilon subunit [Kitasatospora sp. NPDC058162]|uniref:acyl-CoA carboxylase epsilon subunit n=1 Tax=Kitasatospora sp. NPDC058162 TaxID=3346362 RepID=UPI0036D78AC9
MGADNTAQDPYGPNAPGAEAPEENAAEDPTEVLPEQAWRIVRGVLDAEELAALTAVLVRCYGRAGAQAAGAAELRRVDAKWSPAEARRKAATSWAAGPRPSWRTAA